MSYVKPMITTNQKPMTDAQKTKRKKSNQSTKGSHQCTGIESKRRKKTEKNTKITRKNATK